MKWRGRMNYPAGEKRVLTQAAARLAALVGLVLLIEFGTGTNKMLWYAVLWIVPLELFLLLTSFKVLDSLKTALRRWFVVPLIGWIGRRA